MVNRNKGGRGRRNERNVEINEECGNKQRWKTAGGRAEKEKKLNEICKERGGSGGEGEDYVEEDTLEERRRWKMMKESCGSGGVK